MANVFGCVFNLLSFLGGYYWHQVESKNVEEKAFKTSISLAIGRGKERIF